MRLHDGIVFRATPQFKRQPVVFAYGEESSGNECAILTFCSL